jgi:hypothetical protein
MKLELKHIAPYLPYGVKFYVFDDPKFEKDYLKKYPNGQSRVDITISNVIDKIFKDRYKPILRPLSDLTKENINEMIEYSDFENIYFSSNPSDLIFINTEEKNYLSDIYRNLEFLFKNHFDVFGLIDAGLAIDINTLND